MRLAREFGLEVGQLGSAGAGAGRVAALSHEAGDHAVEHDTVVKAAVGELGDALDVAGRKVRAKLDDDVAAAREGKGQAVGVGHGMNSVSESFEGARFRRPRWLRQSSGDHRRARTGSNRGEQHVSESEHIAAAAPEDSASASMDDEDRLRPEFVDKVLDAVEAGDDETARELVEPLHPADVADLIELAAARRARRAGKGARRDRQPRRARRDERLRPRRPARRDGAAAGRGHRRAARYRRRGRADRGSRPRRAAGGAPARWSPTTAPRSRRRSAIRRNPPAA